MLALAKLVEHRDGVSSARLTRLQHYTRSLAEEAVRVALYGPEIDRHFIELLACTVPLLDIGKVGLPDHILLKPGKLTTDERIIMQAHTIIGSDILNAVAQQHGSARLPADGYRHRPSPSRCCDGKGYPNRLEGSAIPWRRGWRRRATFTTPCVRAACTVPGWPIRSPCR